MPTRQQEIYDIKRLLSKGGITDDSRLNDNHLGFLVDQKRAKEIRDTFKRNAVIEPVWLQDIGIFNLTPVNKAEDKSVSVCDCKFSKAMLPPVVSIMDSISNTPDIGTYSIRSATGESEYHYMNVTKMGLLNPSSIQSKMRNYTKIGNAIYLTPEVLKARAILILDSPLDGFILDNMYIVSGTLAIGTSYTVASGNITHNGIKYQLGQTFVAVNADFTGPGQIQYLNQKRKMTNNDPYPMSHTMGEVVKKKILIDDFGFEAQMVNDIINDSKDDAQKK